MPKVSINIITHNRKQLLKKAIASVFEQTYTDFELIIVDDGSTDNTEVVVSQFQDKRIKYKKIEKQNNVSAVRNKALSLSTGEYIALLDDDDIWIDKDKLRQQVEFLDKNHGHVLVGTGAIVVDENDKEKYRFLNPQDDKKIKSNMLSRCLFVNSSTMFKNETAKKIHFEKILTTEIRNYIKAPKEVHLRIDFVGGWLDVPKFAREGAYIVDCTISPKVSLKNWPYKIGSGLGGSAAYALLTGKDSIKSELALGVGWQDPAVIMEEGLCVWKSGQKPELDFKINPNFLNNKLALLWTGKDHTSYNLVDMKRDYDKIEEAGKLAREAVNPLNIDYKKLCHAVNLSYDVQIEEGMDPLPHYGELAKKYCGGGHGGYALYMFESEKEGYDFLNKKDAVKINF